MVFLCKTAKSWYWRLVAIAVLFLASPSTLYGQFDFATNNGDIVVTRYTGAGGTVIIPAVTNGFPVTSIGTYAFLNIFNVTNVSIPESVTNIGSGAFNYCGGLVSITIPASVTAIGEQAFQNCSSLTSIRIPLGVRTIESGSFFQCSSLTNIDIANGVTNIGESAFYSCGGLASVLIPDSVQAIGPNAFGFCLSMTNVSIPANVAHIAGNSFYACFALESFFVDDNNPFYTVKDGVLLSKDLTLLVACPPGKSGSYDIPSDVKNIGEFAFAVCRNITNLNIPGSVTNLGFWSFSQCDNISTITIPKSIQYVDDFAFQDCASLRRVFFQGDAPVVSGFGARPFDNPVNLYYLPGTTGWDAFFAFLNQYGVLWNPTVRSDSENFGLGTNGLGFNITGTADIPFVVEATTNLTGSVWTALELGTLTNGLIHFNDPESVHCFQRFYRIRGR
jgi:hypothetical protein